MARPSFYLAKPYAKEFNLSNRRLAGYQPGFYLFSSRLLLFSAISRGMKGLL